MTQQKFKFNCQPGMAKSGSGSLARKLFKRVGIPAILLAALAFGMSGRSVVKVQADDCNLDSIELASCYTNCENIDDIFL